MYKRRNIFIESMNFYNQEIVNGNENKDLITNDNNLFNNENKKDNMTGKKQNSELKSLEPKKQTANSFSKEIEFIFEKKNTSIKDNNCGINNDIIFKRMLENKINKKKEGAMPIKIIKCEKINIKDINKKFKSNNKTRNHSFLETKLNSKNDLILKTEIINENKKDNKLNKKGQNKICMNNSITFISQKRESLTERKNNKTNKKIILRKKLKNCEIKKKIENKGYLDSTDFMNVVNEDNNLKKNKKEIIDKKTQKNNKGNIKLAEKKIIEILKKINSRNLKHKTKEKKEKTDNNELLIDNSNNLNNNINYNKNDKNNNKEGNTNDIEYLNKEIEELKNNLNIKNFNDIKIKIISNKFQNKKKEENKSLKSLQLKKKNYKTIKYKLKDGQSDNDIIRILEIKNENNINKLEKEKKINQKNVKIINNRNLITNKENTNKIIQRYNQDEIHTNTNNNVNKKVSDNNKIIKNLVLKPSKLGINLTKKMKKYYSIKNKTFEEVNNNSYKNLLKKEKNLSKFDNINYIRNINKQLELNKISNDINDIRKNSDLTNKLFYNQTEINNNSKITQINDNIKSCDFEKSKIYNKYQNETKHNLNLTTRDETFKTYNNSKDILENNELNNLIKESVNDNNQIKSCDSQVISGINGPNTTYFSGFNKSELKLLNKINLDMPVNLDLCNEENKNIKDDNIKDNLEDIKINIEDNSKNKKINDISKPQDKKIEKLENFINEFNENDNNFEEGKIIQFNNETPLYGKSVAEINFLSNDLSSNIKKEDNKNKEIKNDKPDINKIKNNFNDDIFINCEKEDDKKEKKFKSYSSNNFDFLDIDDLPNNDEDFLDNIELIQKNNFRYISNNEIDKNKKETIKDIDTEYEFNFDEGKFSDPLQKYDEKLNFNKINPF